MTLPDVDPRPTVSRCQSCNARIVWLITERGKWMPVDADPDDDGNVSMENNPGARAPLARVLRKGDLFEARDEAWGGARFHTHFQTCPNADDHRGSARRSKGGPLG